MFNVRAFLPVVAFAAIVGAWAMLRAGDGHPSAPPGLAAETPPGGAQAALEEAAMAYGQAVQRGDTAALQALLARQCAGADAGAIIAARRKLFSEETGTSLAKATVVRPQMVHFDEAAGIAHLYLGFARGERRLYTRQLDGWTMEEGTWRSIECAGPASR